MKRPLPVYLLVGFWGVLLAIDLLFIFQGRTAVLGNEQIYSPWRYLPDWKDKLILISIGIAPAAVMVGVWLGKSWARNLSIALCAFVILSNGKVLLEVFSISSSDDFVGLTKFATFVALGVLLFFLAGFYFTLRPEVGRFCGVYPRRTDQG